MLICCHLYVQSPISVNRNECPNVRIKWFSSTKSQRPIITAILTHLDGLEDSKSLESLKTISGSQIVKAGVTTVAKKMETLATPPGE